MIQVFLAYAVGLLIAYLVSATVKKSWVLDNPFSLALKVACGLFAAWLLASFGGKVFYAVMVVCGILSFHLEALLKRITKS